ncbi:MAG: hypothetical protein LBR24_01970 [Methanobrevibacter sp.]|nr:hypothetical protein [Methanobrevibacter sp.]
MFFYKKKKTPEKELVDELVGSGFAMSKNLVYLDLTAVERSILQKTVKTVWKDGDSVNKIQKAYDDTLATLLKDK